MAETYRVRGEWELVVVEGESDAAVDAQVEGLERAGWRSVGERVAYGGGVLDEGGKRVVIQPMERRCRGDKGAVEG